ncbi:hypothetical protein [Zooshikella ganghwensis]|uniref:Uncharacterized protein n=1 Tax=Zooshikella ganghwensis TaxID=202772 RepID=A0A4P9VJX5_9GAMM|nr:hypothetical protein [Zooshikella ganghwensis]RDH42839.1 hypothetical protein B9G39_04885 [Zooshikella ganghwensis]
MLVVKKEPHPKKYTPEHFINETQGIINKLGRISPPIDYGATDNARPLIQTTVSADEVSGIILEKYGVKLGIPITILLAAIEIAVYLINIYAPYWLKLTGNIGSLVSGIVSIVAFSKQKQYPFLAAALLLIISMMLTGHGLYLNAKDFIDGTCKEEGPGCQWHLMGIPFGYGINEVVSYLWSRAERQIRHQVNHDTIV